MKFPKQTPNIKWERAEDAYLLFHPINKQPFQIDELAFMIWAQCDGKTSVQKIVDVFTVGSNREIVTASVNGILDKLKDAGFIK